MSHRNDKHGRFTEIPTGRQVPWAKLAFVYRKPKTQRAKIVSLFSWSPPQFAEARFTPSYRRVILADITAPKAMNATVFLQP